MAAADIITFGGASVSLSATLPTTYNQAGFENIAIIYTEVGDLATVPQMTGINVNDVSFNIVNSNDTHHRKGTRDRPEKTFDIYVNDSDAGQALLDAAAASDNQYTMKVVYNNGEIHYATILLYTKDGDGGGNDDIRQQTITFRIDPQGVVVVPAP